MSAHRQVLQRPRHLPTVKPSQLIPNPRVAAYEPRERVRMGGDAWWLLGTFVFLISAGIIASAWLM